jgi:hypothetical protein
MGENLIKKILKLEILGAFFIIFLGSLLHFTYKWSGRFWLVGIFSAVNESTWEHLKLAVFPATLWFLFEWRWLKKEKIPNFVFAKVKGIFFNAGGDCGDFLFLHGNFGEKLFIF